MGRVDEVTDWTRWRTQLRADANQYQALREKVAALRVVEEAMSGAISVTVDGDGHVVDIAVADRVAGTKPSELGAAIMATIRRAQSRVVERVAGTARETLGEHEPAVSAMYDRLRSRFPDQPPEPPARRWRRPAARQEQQSWSPAAPESPAAGSADKDRDDWFDNPGILQRGRS